MAPRKYRVALALFIATKIATYAVLLVWLMSASSGCRHAQGAPLAVVPNLDLTRYAGTWYEYASIPNPFQKGCHDTRAIYRLRKGGDIEVANSCRRGSHQSARTEAKGRAWQPDARAPAKLRVRFFWPFSGDYWVLGLGPEYSWAVVGQPSRRYGWILSREPNLSPTDQGKAMTILTRAGYDVDRFAVTPQQNP